MSYKSDQLISVKYGSYSLLCINQAMIVLVLMFCGYVKEDDDGDGNGWGRNAAASLDS